MILFALFWVGTAAADLRGYVSKPDTSFAWRLRDNHGSAQGTHYRLELRSQTWRGVPWQHELHLFTPKTASGKLAVLFVGTGPHDPMDLAVRVKAPVAVLTAVPNQPLLDGKYEDELIAETFMRFIATGEDDWPLLLPMLKSVVRAMDALQAFSRQHGGSIEGFVVTGASKRGWTSWLTAAIDARVRGVAPRVIDMLNVAAQMPHQLESWGQYSEMLAPYTNPGLPKFADSPQGRRLIEIVDPYSYRDHLDMPKLVLLGTNDRYWTLDALNLYWPNLPGPKSVLYIPNAGHSLASEDAWLDALACFFVSVRAGEPLPPIEARARRDDDRLNLTVRADVLAREVDLWQAQSPTRDFREARWTSSPMPSSAQGWSGQIVLRDAAYTAAFATVHFELHGQRCALSTPVTIEPPAQK
ncbi:MAG TPA: PhoPQ-activated protein PqaA family protein [Burkholderiales bacterium]|nr:PhoPQ-activated protein PqaA family protein [Burkholderiales bacterium]